MDNTNFIINKFIDLYNDLLDNFEDDNFNIENNILIYIFNSLLDSLLKFENERNLRKIPIDLII